MTCMCMDMILIFIMLMLVPVVHVMHIVIHILVNTCYIIYSIMLLLVQYVMSCFSNPITACMVETGSHRLSIINT